MQDNGNKSRRPKRFPNYPQKEQNDKLMAQDRPKPEGSKNYVCDQA